MRNELQVKQSAELGEAVGPGLHESRLLTSPGKFTQPRARSSAQLCSMPYFESVYELEHEPGWSSIEGGEDAARDILQDRLIGRR